MRERNTSHWIPGFARLLYFNFCERKFIANVGESINEIYQRFHGEEFTLKSSTSLQTVITNVHYTKS